MNRYLIDTNVISEQMKRTPVKEVDQWLHSLNTNQVFLSVITIAEIKIGALRSKEGALKTKILHWLDYTLLNKLKNNVLPIDVDTVNIWADIRGGGLRTLPLTDTLLAATALKHGLTVATRNVKDFVIPGLEVYNPFPSS